MNGISLSAADTCRGPLVLVNAQHPYRGGAPALSPALGAEDIEAMKELALILRKKRKKKGSIDFDFPECKIKLDDKGHPIAIEPYDRNIATKIIEEFMLAANHKPTTVSPFNGPVRIASSEPA